MIGVIGVWIWRPGQNMAIIGSVIFASLAMGLLLTWILDKSKIQTLGMMLFFKSTSESTVWYRTFWGWETLVVFLVTFFVSLIVTKFSLRELSYPQGIDAAKRIFGALATPSFSVFPEGLLAITETIFIAFAATTLAIPFAFIFGFLAAKNIMNKNKYAFMVYLFFRALCNITRSIEPLIWAIIFSVWVGIGPFAGMLALCLHSIASLTKQYSEIVEVASDGPCDGILSTGANAIQVIWFGIVPQVILPMISFTIYRWDINVRMATIIGLVGGGGIGTLLMMYQGQAMWHEVGTLALLIVVVVWFMDTASAYIREALK